MKKIYYEKRGRRYVPVAENDYDMFDAFPKGSHLVMCYPGGQTQNNLHLPSIVGCPNL